MPATLEKPRTVRDEIQQVIVQLALCSHVSAALPDSEPKDASEAVGGKRPPGGPEERLSKKASVEERLDHRTFALKSADHFIRRLEKAHSTRALEAILKDAQDSLSAWKRRPPESKEPVWGDPACGRWIAESKESYDALGKRFGVSNARISQIRKAYAAPTTRIRRYKCVVCKAAKSEEGRTMCSACEEFAELRDSVGDPFDEEVAVA